jgi:hypothetical protein
MYFLNRLVKSFFEYLGKGLISINQLNPMRRGCPHHLRAALPKDGWRFGCPPWRCTVIAGAPGIPALGLSIRQNRFLTSLGAATQMKNGTGGPF